VDIATDGSYIYALFIRSAGQYGGQYNTSALVRLSLPLTALAVSEEIAENAVNLKFWTEAGEDPTTWIYIPAIGGEQEYGGQYNDPSVIQRIPASFSSEDSPQTLLVNYQSGSGGTSQIVDQTNFYDISFNADGDKVFILKGVYNTSSNFTWHLFGTTMEVLNAASSALISAVVPSIAAYATGAFPNGFVWALPYDAADDVTWFVRGNEVLIYDYDGAALAATTAEMGVGDPAGTGYLATSGFNINGAAAYGFVGTIKGAAHPSKASVAARAAAASKAEEEK
jgi:hypothetical protein